MEDHRKALLRGKRRDAPHRVVIDANPYFAAGFSAGDGRIGVVHQDELAKAPVPALPKLAPELAQDETDVARLIDATLEKLVALAADERDEAPRIASRVVERLLVGRRAAGARVAVVARHQHHRLDPGAVHRLQQVLGGNVAVEMVVRIDQRKGRCCRRFDSNGGAVHPGAAEDPGHVDRNRLARLPVTGRSRTRTGRAVMAISVLRMTRLIGKSLSIGPEASLESAAIAAARPGPSMLLHDHVRSEARLDDSQRESRAGGERRRRGRGRPRWRARSSGGRPA